MAIRKFFEKIRNEPWFKNTIFVFSADHTSSHATLPTYKQSVGWFRVPIFFYAPGLSIEKKSENSIQQLDVCNKVNLRSVLMDFDMVVCALPGFLGYETLKQIIEAGDGVYIQPNLLHSAICIEEGMLIDTFSPVREDFLSGGAVSYFGDKD